jgi:phage FluMu protein Com
MITINGKDYKELRCQRCQKFVIYQNIAAGIACYICPRCKHVNEFSFKYLKTADNEAMIKKDYSLVMKGGE